MATSNISPSPYPPKRILVAIDGSDNSGRAEEAAIELAKEYGAELLIINVATIPVYVYSEPYYAAPLDLKDMLQSAENEGMKLVHAAEERAKSQGVKTRTKVLDSIASVVSGIIDYAENERVDLIVIGTRGLGGFKKLLQGSVSSGVVTHAHCNVMVVR